MASSSPATDLDVVPRSRGPVVVSAATDGGEWDSYVSAHPEATADHLWGWTRVFSAALRQTPRFLIGRRNGTPCGVLPLVLFQSRLFGRSAISLPFLNYGGMLVDDAAVGQALLETATREASAFRASHVELRHVARQCDALPFRQHKLRMAMPLAGTSEALWSALDRKIRNQVRKAQKENLVVASGGAELVGEFYAVFARNMRDLGTPVYPMRLFSETLAAFPDRARVHLVRRGSQAIAAGFTVHFRDTVLNPWASSLREFRSLCPNVLLYWVMLEQAILAGASVFDFGRSSPGGGTHQFKEQWGAEATPMHWEYVLLSRAAPPDQGPSNPRFERLIDTWKRLPLSVANVVGPIIARQLP